VAQETGSTRARNPLREWRHGTRALAGTRMIVRRKALIFSSLALLIVASCRAQNDSPVTNSASSDTVVSATPPFKTKEPERYRATRTITSVTADGKTNVITHSIARDGEFRRIEAEVVSKKMIFLDFPGGKLLLLPD